MGYQIEKNLISNQSQFIPKGGSVYRFYLLQDIERHVYLSDILLVTGMLVVATVFTVLILRWRLAVSVDSAPKFYRYDLQIHHCPFCEHPVVGRGDQVCANCGHTLALESVIC